MLTTAQCTLLGIIHQSIIETGGSPTYEEMMVATGLRSKSVIHREIGCLVERGFIRRRPHRARAIEVLRLPPSMGGKCPTCGHVKEKAL